jgi:hypothetical protein
MRRASSLCRIPSCVMFGYQVARAATAAQLTDPSAEDQLHSFDQTFARPDFLTSHVVMQR